MFATMNDISWDGTVESVSTRKPSRFENDEFIKAKAEPWINYILSGAAAAAIIAQTVEDQVRTGQQIASDVSIAQAQELVAGKRSVYETAEQALQTGHMYAALLQTWKEWDEADATKKQWEARNSADFTTKANQRAYELAGAKKQLDLSKESIGLDRDDIGLGIDKVTNNFTRTFVEDLKREENEKQFEVDSAAARTKRDATAATEYAEEEAAGIAGTGVDDMGSYLGALGARTGEFVDEAKAFTDPLLAAAPGSTVGGSRYGGDFATASGPASWGRDGRERDIAAFAAAMDESRDPLANIDIGQATQGAQQDRINREVGLAGADQSLAAAGLRNKVTMLGEIDTDIDRADLGIDLTGLGIDKKRTNIDSSLRDTQYDDIFHKLATQGHLDRTAQAYPKTLHGQQSVMFPAAQMLGQGSRLAGQFKPAQTQIKPQATSNFGSMSYGPPRGTSGLGWQGR